MSGGPGSGGSGTPGIFGRRSILLDPTSPSYTGAARAEASGASGGEGPAVSGQVLVTHGEGPFGGQLFPEEVLTLALEGRELLPAVYYDADAGGMTTVPDGSGSGSGPLGLSLERGLRSIESSASRAQQEHSSETYRSRRRTLLYADVTSYTTSSTMTIVDCQGNPTAMYAR